MNQPVNIGCDTQIKLLFRANQPQETGTLDPAVWNAYKKIVPHGHKIEELLSRGLKLGATVSSKLYIPSESVRAVPVMLVDNDSKRKLQARIMRVETKHCKEQDISLSYIINNGCFCVMPVDLPKMPREYIELISVFFGLSLFEYFAGKVPVYSMNGRRL